MLQTRLPITLHRYDLKMRVRRILYGMPHRIMHDEYNDVWYRRYYFFEHGFRKAIYTAIYCTVITRRF